VRKNLAERVHHDGARVRKAAKTTLQDDCDRGWKEIACAWERPLGKPAETGPSERIRTLKDRLSACESEFGVNHKTRAIHNDDAVGKTAGSSA
jgi:hypothetical protein